MTKEEYRRHALQHRASIREGDEDIEHSAILFQEAVDLTTNPVVSAYWPIKNEFDVRYMMEVCFKEGITVALPVVQKGSKILKFSRWDGKAALVKTAFGLFVPPANDFVEPDILLVPLLAFDRKGNRLGWGGGYYDATLADLRQKRDILAIGVGYAAQAVLFSLPAEPHDQAMDMIITPAGIQDFRK